MDFTCLYQIQVRGLLSPTILDNFGELNLYALSNGDTLMLGALPDEAALHDILNLLRNIGLSLIKVERLDTIEPIHTVS